MSKVFCSADTSVSTCPKCGVELTSTEYLTGVFDTRDTVSKEHAVGANQAKLTTTTTTSTKYTDVRSHTGKICMYCCYKSLASKIAISRILIIAGAVIVIAALVVSTLILGISDTVAFILGALGAICFAIGWKMMGNDGIVGNPYKTSKGVSPIPTSSVYMDSATHDYVSRLFVKYYPRSKIPKGYTLLYRNAFNTKK